MSEMTCFFAGKSYSEENSARERQIMTEAVMASWRDGYEGRP
ncbi:hypothetical protein ABW286_09275 [Erwinia papayae]|uniref:Uncharacterized protein n=1 Tax=Erwinia papayae TaxID=206499 RepID=A0ABV3N0M3_9GAMM